MLLRLDKLSIRKNDKNRNFEVFDKTKNDCSRRERHENLLLVEPSAKKKE